MAMVKKYAAILVIPILILALSCKPESGATATDTGTTTTDTSGTTATATSATATTDTIAPPVQHEIDHYKIWKVKSVPFARTVKLQGQFDEQSWEARVRSIEYLGNPVEKNGEPILKPDWHLVGYSLKAPPQPPRSVTIENQFRKGETLRITDAAWLLLPASKNLDGQPPEPPKEADHYLCYTVLPTDPITTPVKLMDQFDRRRQDSEEIKQLWAAFFCVPVSKDGGTIYKPKEHLTVYRLDPPDPYPLSAATWDQFGQRKLSVERSEFLAVPTTKLDWKKQ
jgi:hypothetical protein